MVKKKIWVFHYDDSMWNMFKSELWPMLPLLACALIIVDVLNSPSAKGFIDRLSDSQKWILLGSALSLATMFVVERILVSIRSIMEMKKK